MATVHTNGYETSYTFNGVEEREDGKKLVLIHGAGGQEVDWPMAWRSVNDITRSLGLTPKDHGGKLDDFPIYAVDLPGHGKSGGQSMKSVREYADAVAAFVDAMDLKNVCLVGHSMGAGIALTIANNNNKRVSSIAMIGGASKMIVSDSILDGLKNNFVPTIDNIVKYSWYKNTGAFFKQKMRQRMIDAGSDVVFDDFFACSQLDLSERLEHVHIPALVIASDFDRMVPLDVSRKMADKMGNAKFVPLEKCGHFQHIEQTGKVAEEIANFLAGLE